jgi:hypothetical protein
MALNNMKDTIMLHFQKGERKVKIMNEGFLEL